MAEGRTTSSPSAERTRWADALGAPLAASQLSGRAAELLSAEGMATHVSQAAGCCTMGMQQSRSRCFKIWVGGAAHCQRELTSHREKRAGSQNMLLALGWLRKYSEDHPVVIFRRC